MPTHECRPRAILEMTFQCEVCDEDKPVCEAVRIPHGAAATDPHLDLCRGCYDAGVEDGMVDPATGTFIID
jgi:hypothetical protein